MWSYYKILGLYLLEIFTELQMTPHPCKDQTKDDVQNLSIKNSKTLLKINQNNWMYFLFMS